MSLTTSRTPNHCSLKLKSKNQKNIVIGVIYRPPDQNMKEFNKSIDTLLSKIADQEKKLLYIMGDFNINLLNNDVHESTGEFVDILSSHSLYASIVKPTRITSKSATLIDNIFTNNLSNQTSGILMSDISDHLPICTLLVFLWICQKAFDTIDHDILLHKIIPLWFPWYIL